MKTTEQLRVGDCMKVWWKPGRDIITELKPYRGSLRECLGARLAKFAINTAGMTLMKGEDHETITPNT